MSNNVIEASFGGRREKGSEKIGISALTTQVGAEIHSLSAISHVPWVKTALQRVSKRDPIFREFFDNLFRVRSVSIRSDEPEITLASIMKVTDPENNGEWELDVANFIRFVDIPPHALADEEFTVFMSHLMNVADITIGLSVNDNEDDEASQNRTRDRADVPDFSLSKPFLARWNGTQFVDDFECVINTADIENSLYIHANRFGNPHETPLWYMALHMVIQGLESGIAPDSQIPIEITHYKDDITDTVCMTFSELIQMTYDELMLIRELWPYRNYEDRFKALTTIHAKYVSPRILPLDEIPYDEED